VSFPTADVSYQADTRPCLERIFWLPPRPISMYTVSSTRKKCMTGGPLACHSVRALIVTIRIFAGFHSDLNFLTIHGKSRV
jgi:hypothetical protein